MVGSSIFAVGSPNLHGRMLGMRFGRWRLWFLVGSALLFVIWFFTLSNRDSVIALVTKLGALGSGAFPFVTWLWDRLWPTKNTRWSLERAADELAKQLRRQWKRAAAERGLTSMPRSLS
jgi:hypothetical protein